MKIIGSTFLGVLIPTVVFAEGGTHLPDVIGSFFHHGILHDLKPLFFALFVSVVLCFFVIKVYRNRKMIPGPLQNVIELLVEGMYNFFEGILGKHTKQYIPFVGTLFFYILGMNLMGIIPGGFSPSTALEVTGSLAVIVFIYVQYTGISKLGFLKYIDHLMGEPRDAIGWGMVIIMFPLHIVGEFVKPVSLAARLFGNITGEDILVFAFVSLGLTLMHVFVDIPVGVPLNVPFILLGLLLSTIQALVFSMLSAIYILLMLPHEEAHA